MASESDDLRHLREALSAFVADDVPELLAEARGEARSRVRAVLAEVMAEGMLAQARRQAESGDSVPAPPRAARQSSRRPERRPSRQSQAREPLAPPSASASAASAGPQAEGELGYYIYGVLAADAAVAPDLPGVEPSQPATALVVGGLAALVSRVPLAEFNEERLREHLGDIAWVETIARRHEQVLEAAAAVATVIPMRLCTIYRDAGGIQTMLERESEPMHEALGLLDGRSEWGVKLFAVALPDPSADPQSTPAASGAAYLEQRRQAQDQRESAAQRLSTVADTIHSRLSAVAARARVIPLQRPEVSGHSGEMALNGVYLVDDATLASFHETLDALQTQFSAAGIELVATGPWPPYNFVPDAIGVMA